MVTACNVINATPIEQFNNYVSNCVAKDAIMVSFDNLTTKTVELNYEQIQITNSNNRDYCFDGLIYNKVYGYMYYAPDSTDNFIPLLDVSKLFSILIKKNFNRDVDVPLRAIDNFLQNTKVHYQGDEGYNGLLGELVNYYNSSNQKTIIGKLLVGGPGSRSEVRISMDEFENFMKEIVSVVTRLTKLFVKAMTSIEIDELSLLNTNIEICKATEHIYETSAWKKVEHIVDNNLHNLMAELSTNVIFNPSSREWLDRILDTNRPSGFAKLNGKTQEDYYKYLDVMNVQDFLSDENYQIFATIGNSLVDENDVKGLDFNTKRGKVIKTQRISAMVRNANTNKPTNDIINQTLDTIETEEDSFLDPTMFAMSNRFMKNLTNLLQKLYR